MKNIKELSKYELKIGLINSYICLTKQESIDIRVLKIVKDLIFNKVKEIENSIDNFITCKNCNFKSLISQFNFTASKKCKRIELICPKCNNICEVL